MKDLGVVFGSLDLPSDVEVESSAWAEEFASRNICEADPGYWRLIRKVHGSALLHSWIAVVPALARDTRLAGLEVLPKRRIQFFFDDFTSGWHSDSAADQDCSPLVSVVLCMSGAVEFTWSRDFTKGEHQLGTSGVMEYSRAIPSSVKSRILREGDFAFFGPYTPHKISSTSQSAMTVDLRLSIPHRAHIEHLLYPHHFPRVYARRPPKRLFPSTHHRFMLPTPVLDDQDAHGEETE